MKVVPTGVSRTVKKLMRTKLPNLGHHSDIADLFLGQGLSDSEGEQDGPHSQVTVTQKVKDRGVARNAVSAIRLKEIGPRLSLQLIKIEEGFEAGNILYHALVQKTQEEIEALREKRHIKQKSKLTRKQRQDANVMKKKEAKDEQVRKTLEGMKRKEGTKDEDVTQKDMETNLSENSDDDTEYYKQEVGQEPEPEMFSQSKKRKREGETNTEPRPKKRRPNKFSSNKHGGREADTDGKVKKKFSVKFSHKETKGDKKFKKISAGHNKHKKFVKRPWSNKRKK